MSIFWDGLITIITFFFFVKLRNNQTTKTNKYFALFFVWMGISTLLGLFGHLFFLYFGFLGKFPSWFCIVITSYYFSLAILRINQVPLKKWKVFLLLKGLILLSLSYLNYTFNFVAIDSVFSYILLGTYFGKKLNKEMKNNFLLLGSLLILPTLFIFGLKIQIHPYFNKDDFSHLFILISLFFYYFCSTKNVNYDI